MIDYRAGEKSKSSDEIVERGKTVGGGMIDTSVDVPQLVFEMMMF